MFHTKVFKPLTILSVFKYIILIIGIALFITVIGLVSYKRYQILRTVTDVPVEAGDETTPLLT
jgi:hypothetical protein